MDRFHPRPITQEGIQRALGKVERYRLLNEPWAAESICLDILQIEPNHQEALVQMIFAIADQFGGEAGPDMARAQALLPRVSSDYQRAYCAGIICERRAKARLLGHAPGTGPAVYHWLREAMNHFEAAERLRQPGNDDALLRWNTCVRLIARYPQVQPAGEEERRPVELE
jgi:hypothetical protein